MLSKLFSTAKHNNGIFKISDQRAFTTYEKSGKGGLGVKKWRAVVDVLCTQQGGLAFAPSSQLPALRLLPAPRGGLGPGPVVV